MHLFSAHTDDTATGLQAVAAQDAPAVPGVKTTSKPGKKTAKRSIKAANKKATKPAKGRRVSVASAKGKPVKGEAAKAAVPGKRRGRPPGSGKKALTPTPGKRRGRPPGSGKKAKSTKVAKPLNAGMDVGLAAALKQKIAAAGLNVTAAAQAIGVAPLSLRRLLVGKAKANARTVKKYASFLGAAVPAQKAGTVKPGRKPGRKAAVVRSGAQGGWRGAIETLRQALSAASDPVSGDDLARAVHQAPAATRKVIAAVLSAI